MAAHPEPKERNDSPEVKALEHLEQLEERVLDANLNLSQVYCSRILIEIGNYSTLNISDYRN